MFISRIGSIVLFSAVFLIAVGCSSPEIPADMIFVGGSVWTGVPGEPEAEAMAVKAGFV